MSTWRGENCVSLLLTFRLLVRWCISFSRLRCHIIDVCSLCTVQEKESGMKTIHTPNPYQNTGRAQHFVFPISLEYNANATEKNQYRISFETQSMSIHCCCHGFQSATSKHFRSETLVRKIYDYSLHALYSRFSALSLLFIKIENCMYELWTKKNTYLVWRFTCLHNPIYIQDKYYEHLTAVDVIRLLQLDSRTARIQCNFSEWNFRRDSKLYTPTCHTID